MKDKLMRQGFRMVMVGSLVLMLAGCSSMNVFSTTDGTELGSQGKGGRGDSGRLGKGGDSGGLTGREPLTGFSKGPADESVGKSAPLMLSKADQETSAARRMREGNRKGLADIYFAFDQSDLTEEGKKNLEESAAFLKDHPRAKVMIEGHCDERGTIEYNLALGEKRAREARQYLADLGVKNFLVITSFGKERQVCEEHDESCYWRNRRAHLSFEAGQ
jgi:peptidoglycan-associated lipoprotein